MLSAHVDLDIVLTNGVPVKFAGALPPHGSPGQHVIQAGRGEQRAEVSREDRVPTR